MKKSRLQELAGIITERDEANFTGQLPPLPGGQAQTLEDIKILAKLGVKVSIPKRQGMNGPGNWLIGTANNGKYTIQIKRFDEPSSYGIKNGRISKLNISDPKQRHETGTGVTLVSYERGWDIKPTDPTAKKLVAQIVKAFK
jgi:hypothetical protein